MLKLSSFLKQLGGSEPVLAADPLIHDLATDSRQVKPGDLFFAFPGFQVDGRAYMAQALQKGAAAIIYEAPYDGLLPSADQQVPILPLHGALRERIGPWAACFYGSPADAMTVIGVTGTNGKSSTVAFIQQLLNCMGVKAASIGTLGVHYESHTEEASMTTPDPLSLQKQLKRLKDNGCEVVAMEVSSHALDQERVAGVSFDAAILTNITRDHLDYHKTFQAYAEAKKKLFLWPTLKAIVLNQGDPLGQQWAKAMKGERLWTYQRGVSTHDGIQQITGELITHSIQGMRIAIQTAVSRDMVDWPVVGDVQLENLLGTLTALMALGYPLPDLIRHVSSLKAPWGRMEHFGGDRAPHVFVDYAHTSDALERILKLLRAVAPNRLWVVFGCGGNRDHPKRPMMGKIAAEWADEIILTDDNPRDEEPEGIIQAILQGIPSGHSVQIEPNRVLAIQSAIRRAAQEDVILVAGKGHEAFQIRQGVKIPFSDQEVVQQMLTSIPAKG